MGKPFVILVILLHFLPGISRAQERGPAEQINSLMELGQFSQAIRLAELYLSQDSIDPDLLLLKGRALAAAYRGSPESGKLRQCKHQSIE